MTKLYWLLIITLIYSVPLFAEDKQASTYQPATNIIGSYEGNVFNGDDMDPILTIFFLNNSGELVGKYAIKEDNGLEEGELSNFRMESNYTVVVDWKDNYGTGVLRMLFASNYKIFYGFWGELDTETSLPWNGIQQ